MSNEPLHTRKQILAQLGYKENASRTSWSHDLGEAIVFDAWDHQWEKDPSGKPLRYPLRTIGDGYSLRESQDNPRRGHTRWQSHVDLVLAGSRTAKAILPVAVDPLSRPNKGAKGWRALVIGGTAQTDEQEQVWFVADQVTRLGK